MLALVFFFAFSFILFSVIKVDKLRQNLLPKFLLEKEENLIKKLNYVILDKKKVVIITLVLFVFLVLFILGIGKVWYSVWVIVFGIVYLFIEKEAVRNTYFTVMKSVIVPSYIVHRLSIINISLYLVELVLVDLGVFEGSIWAVTIIGAVVPVAAPIVIAEQTIFSYKEFLIVAKKTGILKEIVGLSNNLAGKDQEVLGYHLAKLIVKEQRGLLSNFKYSAILPSGKMLPENFVTYKNGIGDLIKSKQYFEFKEGYINQRINYGMPESKAIINAISGQDLLAHQKSVKTEADAEVIKAITMLKENCKGVFAEIKDIEAPLSLQKFTVMVPIIENLPNEALQVNPKGEEGLNCVSDFVKQDGGQLVDNIDYKIKNSGKTEVLNTDNVSKQIIETMTLDKAMPYLRSLGEIANIERSPIADFKIIYKDGRELEVECKFSKEDNAKETNVINKFIKYKDKQMVLVWFDTISKNLSIEKLNVDGKTWKSLYKKEMPSTSIKLIKDK